MPSPKTHSWRGLPNNEVITIAHITDCPTVTVHAGKCYQALIDSGAAISLIRHSTYKQIEDCYKTPIQSTATKLSTTDGSPMTILGSTALHLCIADFKFTHNFIICNQLPDTELIFGIDIQKKFSLSYAWDKDQQCYIQCNGRFLAFTHAITQNATVGTVKSTLKIPPRHNGVIPIKISRQQLTTDTAHFVMDDSTHKGKDPNINIIDGIHKIKDRTTIHVIVSNYTNKHLTFHKGEYLGCLEPLELDPTNQEETHQANSITLKKMMAETVTSDTFNPLCHEISTPIWDGLNLLLEEYASQFAQDEMSIGTTPLTSMSIDTGSADPVSQKPYPIAMKHYDWVKKEIEKLLDAKVIHSSHSSWSAPIIVVPKGDRGKCLVIDYRALNKVTRKFTWPMPKVEDIFSKLDGATYFTTLDLHRIPPHPSRQVIHTQDCFQLAFWKI